MGVRFMWLEWSWYLGPSEHSPIGTITDFTIELCQAASQLESHVVRYRRRRFGMMGHDAYLEMLSDVAVLGQSAFTGSLLDLSHDTLTHHLPQRTSCSIEGSCISAKSATPASPLEDSDLSEFFATITT